MLSLGENRQAEKVHSSCSTQRYLNDVGLFWHKTNKQHESCLCTKLGQKLFWTMEIHRAANCHAGNGQMKHFWIDWTPCTKTCPPCKTVQTCANHHNWGGSLHNILGTPSKSCIVFRPGEAERGAACKENHVGVVVVVVAVGEDPLWPDIPCQASHPSL